MRTKNLVAVASVALATAIITVVLGWSGTIEAGSGDTLTPKIATPKLVSHGAEITMTVADGHVFQAGEEPTFTLQAINTTDQPVTMRLAFAMTGTSPTSEMSRVLTLPTNLWQQQQDWVLQPKETKTTTIATQTKLPAGKVIMVSVRDLAPDTKETSPGIVALRFSTALPLLQTASAK